GLTLPDGGVLDCKGTVVAVITQEQAAAAGRRRGLGIKLEPMDGADKARFEQILGAAVAAQPAPEPTGRHTAILSPPATPTPAPAPPPKPAPPPPPGPALRSSPQERIVGIDMGTSYTSVAVAAERKVKIISFPPHGEKSMPSVIHFSSRS